MRTGREEFLLLAEQTAHRGRGPEQSTQAITREIVIDLNTKCWGVGAGESCGGGPRGSVGH